MMADDLRPGQRVRVQQTIERRDRDWHVAVEGVVREVTREPTGSWYAHGQDGRVWLQRLVLRKDDGELTSLVLDGHTRIELLADAPAQAPR